MSSETPAAVNILPAFQSLKHNVSAALRTQVGDAAQLLNQRNLCVSLLESTQRHHAELTYNDYTTIVTSLPKMMECLDQATTASADPPLAPPIQLGHCVTTGERKELAAIFQSSVRTICHCLVDFGISPAEASVSVQTVQPDGNISQSYNPAMGSSDLSSITDSELDSIMDQIHTQFPNFGRRMIDGFLMQMGHRVPRARILQSYYSDIWESKTSSLCILCSRTQFTLAP
ncbi:hypothetical protein C8J56DRAFT_888235 [Mycena floridula]|nr:hypothetical protein C8J56DRAFT_888235 [Mycena floridula]